MSSTENLTIVDGGFSTRLLGKLKEKGISQDALRILLGSKSTGLVSNWIRRNRPPKAAMLLEVSKILETTPHWLLHGDIPEPGGGHEVHEMAHLRERVRTLEGQLKAIQQIASPGAAQLTEKASISYDQKNRRKDAGEAVAETFEEGAKRKPK